MVAGCGNKCIKFLLVFFNVLVCLAGAIILALSLWIRFDKKVLGKVLDVINKTELDVNIEGYYIALYILAAVGGLLLLSGFLGCCGAACESVCMLGMYFAILLFLFLVELGVGIYILVKGKDTFKDAIGKTIAESIKTTEKGSDQDTSLAQFQVDMECCGGNGRRDYDDAGKTDLNSYNSETCTRSPTAPSCAEVVFKNVEKYSVIIGGVAIGILVIELLGMIFAMVLCCAMRSESYAYRY